jgi:Tfp pilus assembly protein PilV
MTRLHPGAGLADLMGVMRGIPRRDPTGPDGPLASEAGFALIEVMVSAVLLVVLALATLQLLDRAQASSANTRARGVASSLAQADQEAIRQLPISQLAGGYHPGPQYKTVAKTTYTVESSAEWTRDATGLVTCSNTSGQIEYLRIKSTVTWPTMGQTKPIVMDGIVTPGVAALGINRGALTVLLTKGDGTGASGIAVSAAGVSATTDANGCAVLGNLPSGPQKLTYDTAGYVNENGLDAISKDVSIGNGTTSQATGFYDLAGEIDVNLVDDLGAAAKWPTVFFSHSQRAPATFTQNTGGATSITSPALFPFSSAYRFYAGNCDGNDPTGYLSSFAGASQLVAPGTSYTKNALLNRLKVTVLDSTGAKLNGARISVAPDLSDPDMAGCSEKVLATAGFVTGSGANPTGEARVAVPYGTWKVCADAVSGSKVAKIATVYGSAAGNGPIVNTPSGATPAPRMTTTVKLPAYTTGTQPAANWCS